MTARVTRSIAVFGSMVACVLATSLPVAARAQRAGNGDSLSSSAVAESLAVLETLAGAVRANRNDAAAWFRQGMIAWALADRAMVKPSVSGLDLTRLRNLADTSLRIAADIVPKSVQYNLMAGEYLRSPHAFPNPAAQRFLDAAAVAAQSETDAATRARAAADAGRMYWLQYEDEAHRRIYTASPGGMCPYGLPPSIDSASIHGVFNLPEPVPPDSIYWVDPTDVALKTLRRTLHECTQPVANAGESNYARAAALFRMAVDAAPTDVRAFKQYVMLLAEQKRWKEVETAARRATARMPSEPWSWLVLGLALQRENAADDPAVAFDSAFAHMERTERARMFTFVRLVSHADSARYASAPVDTRVGWEQSFWTMAKPMWSRVSDDPRTEYLARVTYAELRWSVEELGVHGADSDRGEIYIRYGPPDAIGVLRGIDYNGASARAQGGGANVRPVKEVSPDVTMPSLSSVVTFWDYNNGLAFVFWGEPTYGTARFAAGDEVHVARVQEIQATAFDNIADVRIDTMPLRTARFRAQGDSVDVLVVAQAPVAAMREASGAANATIRADAWFLGRGVPDAYRDSVALPANGLKSWIWRVRPAPYLARVEATARGVDAGARAMQWVLADRDSATGFDVRGFGISDVVLATQVTSRPPAARWRDFSVAPLLGAVPRGSQLELLWEDYDVGVRNGQAQYDINITLQRRRSAAGRIAVEIVGALANAVGVTRKDDRVTLQVSRAVPPAPAIVDQVTLKLGDTPAGTYTLTVEITDKATGRKTSRALSLSIDGS